MTGYELLARLYRMIRKPLRIALLHLQSRRRPLRLVIGAGGVPARGWIATDQEQLDLLDPKTWERFFQPESIDALLAEHVWEHLTQDEAHAAAIQCYRYLKPGGYLRVAVPDGYHSSPSYRDIVKPGGSGFGSDDHKVLYTHVSLAQVFESAGFRVELLEYFDEQGVFHNKPWDPAGGLIRRSKEHDERNRDGRLRYTSIILDAHKSANR